METLDTTIKKSKLRTRLAGSLIAVMAVGAGLVSLPGLTSAAEAGTTNGTTYTSDNLGTGVSDELEYSYFYCADGIKGFATLSDDDGYYLDKVAIRCLGSETWSAWQGIGTNNTDLKWKDCEDIDDNEYSIINGLGINARTSEVGAPDELAATCSISDSLRWLGDDTDDTFRPNRSSDSCPSDMILDTIQIWSGTITAHNGDEVDGIANIGFKCNKRGSTI